MEINQYDFVFVLWNIFLALLPCWAVYFLATYKKLRKPIFFWPLFLFWFFMLPNTAYLFTVVRHLVDYCANYDTFRVCADGSWPALFFFTYAAIGLPTFYFALKTMTELIGKKAAALEGIFPIAIMPFVSVGLLYGLYGRFNSWDILRPEVLFWNLVEYFRSPVLREDFAIFTLLLYVIYYVTDFFWKRRK